MAEPGSLRAERSAAGLGVGDRVALWESDEETCGRVERVGSALRIAVRWEVRAGHVGRTTWHDAEALRRLTAP